MINNIFNSIYVKRPITNCKLSPSFKCAQGMDVFQKSDSMRDSKMEENRYSQVDRSIDIDDISNNLKNNTMAFPDVVRGLISVIPTYMKGKLTTNMFVDIYQERASLLYSRLENGMDKAAFSKDFEPEISLIKKLDTACENYRNGNMQGRTFDAIIEKSIITYMKTSQPKNSYYLE